MKYKKWNIGVPAEEEVSRLRGAGYSYLLALGWLSLGWLSLGCWLVFWDGLGLLDCPEPWSPHPASRPAAIVAERSRAVSFLNFIVSSYLS